MFHEYVKYLGNSGGRTQGSVDVLGVGKRANTRFAPTVNEGILIGFK
jgi:hypothetical protein